MHKVKNKSKTSEYNSHLGEIIDKYSYMDKSAFELGVKFNISDMMFEFENSIRGFILCMLVGMQTIILIIGVILMCLPRDVQFMAFKLVPTLVVWLILILVEVIIAKLNKLNKQTKLRLNDIYNALDILHVNGDRPIIELIPTGFEDANNVEFCLGDIVYNKSQDNYWIIKKPSDTIKKQYDIDKDIKYVLVLNNDYNKSIMYLNDENENLELHYRIGDDAYESSFIALLGGTDDDVIKVITKRD